MLGENERGKTQEAFILMVWLVQNPHENTHTHERYQSIKEQMTNIVSVSLSSQWSYIK